MYKIQELINNDTWCDITGSNDYEYICELCRAYSERFKDKIYRVVEVFIYV